MAVRIRLGAQPRNYQLPITKLMDYYLILYFLAGIIQDFLFTSSLRFVAKGKAFFASTCSFLETIVTLVVLYDILTRLDSQRSIVAIICYALGIGIGTFLAMKLKIGLKE